MEAQRPPVVSLLEKADKPKLCLSMDAQHGRFTENSIYDARARRKSEQMNKGYANNRINCILNEICKNTNRKVKFSTHLPAQTSARRQKPAWPDLEKTWPFFRFS